MLEGEQWDRKYSDSYIEKRLRSILLCVCNEGTFKRKSRAKKQLTELVTEVENYDIEQIIYLPLSNIELQDSSLKLGPITLVKITEEIYAELTRQIEELILKKHQLSEEQKRELIELYLGHFKGSVSARHSRACRNRRGNVYQVDLIFL